MTERYVLVTKRVSGGKTYWNNVGAMFKSKTKDGFLLTFDSLPIPVFDQETKELKVLVYATPPNDKDSRGSGSSGGSSDDGVF